MINKRFLVVTSALLALTAGSSAWAQQFARPDDTLDPGGFSTNGPATLHEALITTGTAEFIDSGAANPTTGQISLSSVDDPGVGTGHILRFTCKVEGSKGPETCDVAIYDGGTLIYSVSQQPAARSAWETFSFTLLEAEANNISSAGYADLTVHLTAGISNKASDGDSAQFSWVELEVPASASTAPEVTTDVATVSAVGEATVGGTVTSDGNDPLQEVGVYYSQTSGFTPPGEGTKFQITPVPSVPPGNFAGDLTSLPNGTTYYYRAYAINGIGGTYETNQESFTTWDVPTLLATPTKDNIQLTSATLGGRVTDDGLTTVTECGVVWSDAPAPDLSDVNDFSATALSCDTGVDFTVAAGGLDTGTTYYFRSYAINAVGTAYSAQEGSFVPSGPPALDATVDLGTVTDTQALLGGDITDTGGSAIEAVGIYWDTDGIDTRNDGTHVSMTVAEPSFNQIVTGLPPGSTIYFFAYATNSAGTTDSTIINFPTQAGAPTMDPTPTVANIVGDGADLGGTITADGGGNNLDCGVEWTTVSGEPYESSQSFEAPPDNGTCVEGVPFAVSVSGLTSGQTYYFRAWATSDAGSDVSNEAPFVPQAAPIVTSAAALIPTHNSADLGGDVTSDEGSPVTERGIVWDLDPDPEGRPTRTIVPMGSGTGPFSQTVSLPSGDRIYFEAYATNSSGTAYSTQDRFVDTDTKPTLQATGLVLTPYGRSVRVSWTRGNGDGSLVSIRLSGVGEVPPQPFTDYAADPKYDNSPPPPETSTNSDNFVVYKGSNNTILVHGLALETTYEVAVYEYAGLGTNSDYLTPPLTLSVTTGNTPVHNKDYAVDCEQCHKHGSYRPRQTELENKCKTCHATDEIAATRQEFKNHVLPNRNPDIDYVDCGMCHELHNGALTYTRGLSPFEGTEVLNKSFLRTNVTKYVPNAAEPAILSNDQPKRVDGNVSGYAPIAASTPERAVEGGDNTTARGYCQVCHTLTAYHRSNEAGGTATDAAYGKVGKMQCHDGGDQNIACAPEVHCGDCHEHNNSFQGVNNNLPCEQCHDQPQPPRPVITTQFDLANVVSSHIPNGTPVKADCVVCHGNHGHGGTVPGLDADTGAISGGTSVIPTTATGAGEVFEPHCMSCHEDGSADFQATAGDPDRTATSPFIGTDPQQFPVIDEATWGASAHDRPSGTFPSSPVTCVGDGANGCHGSGHGSQQPKLLAPATGATQTMYAFCVNCHDGAPAPDITVDFTGPTMTETSGSKALINTRHDVTTEDQAYSQASLTCADCHRPHSDPAGVSISDLMTGTTLRDYGPNNTYDNTADGGTYNFSYNGGGNLDPVNPEGSAGGFTAPDMIQYCLVCHDGNGHLPAGVVQDANMEDIANAWAGADVHGSGNATGVGTSTNKGGLKIPWVTSAADQNNEDPSANYAAMNCTTCHGAHGSENIFNLRTSINVAGVQMEIGGVNNMPIPARITDPTVYDLPRTRETARNSGIFVQEDHYWGAWCSFCHKMDGGHPAKVEIDSCTNGHMHNGGAF